MKELKKALGLLFSLPKVIKIYFVIGILASVIANEKPIYIRYQNHSFFPIFTSDKYIQIDGENTLIEFTNWHNLDYQFALFPIIEWSPGKTDLTNSNFISPFAKQYFLDRNGKKIELPFSRRHFLGTARSGEDVLAGLIHGCKIAMIIGLSFMLIAGIIGILIGGIAGYFGDYRLKISFITIFLMSLFFFPALYLSKYINLIHSDYTFLNGIIFLANTILFILIMSSPLFIAKKIKLTNYFRINIPVDFIFMRFVELFLSLPRLILILSIALIFQPSLLMLVIIIGLTSWTDIARITRAEVMKTREIEYVQASKAIGSNFYRLLTRHLLPNIFPSLSGIFIYGFISAILTETGLSFLGIGLPPGTASWGTLMFSAKENFYAWWLVLFPGIAISLLLISLNNLGDKLLKKPIKNTLFVNSF